MAAQRPSTSRGRKVQHPRCAEQGPRQPAAARFDPGCSGPLKFEQHSRCRSSQASSWRTLSCKQCTAGWHTAGSRSLCACTAPRAAVCAAAAAVPPHLPTPAAGRPPPQLLPQQLSSWHRLSSRRCWQLQRQRPRPGAPNGHVIWVRLWGGLRLLWRHGLRSIRLPATRHGVPNGPARHAGWAVPRAWRALPRLPRQRRARHAWRWRLHAGSRPAGRKQRPAGEGRRRAVGTLVC